MNLVATLSVSQAIRLQWDIVVIGAGPAGSIAARELARYGHRVLLVDRRAFPRRKVCGACLNASALRVLTQLELTAVVDSIGGHAINRFTFRHPNGFVSLALAGGRAVSRDALDAALVTAAIEAGVDFLPEVAASLGAKRGEGHEVRLVHADHARTLTSKAIIVATGLGGIKTEEPTGWTTEISKSSRIGTGCVIDDATSHYAPGTIWMAAGRFGYVGLVRVEGGRLNVASAIDRTALRSYGSPGQAAIRLLLEAGFEIPSGLVHADWQGTVALTRRTTPVATRRTFLIGDAAGYVEPFTGEGMTWAIQAGQRVVRWVNQSLNDDNVSSAATAGWCQEYRRHIHNRQRFCRFASSVIRSPLLMKLGTETLNRSPWLAKFVLERIETRNHDYQRLHGEVDLN